MSTWWSPFESKFLFLSYKQPVAVHLKHLQCTSNTSVRLHLILLCAWVYWGYLPMKKEFHHRFNFELIWVQHFDYRYKKNSLKNGWPKMFHLLKSVSLWMGPPKPFRPCSAPVPLYLSLTPPLAPPPTSSDCSFSTGFLSMKQIKNRMF